jgi:hypothetical protein
MKINYNMPDIAKQSLTISVTMTVNEWKEAMRVNNGEFLNLIAQALGDVTRLAEQKYELPSGAPSQIPTGFATGPNAFEIIPSKD